MNGPAIAGAGSQLAIAWFTRGDDDRARVKLALLDGPDAEPIVCVVDEQDPVGRPDVGFLEDGSIVTSWIASEPSVANVRVQRFVVDGSALVPRGQAVVLAPVSGGRREGFPRMATAGRRAMIAWTKAGPVSEVEVRMLDYRR